MVLRAGGDGGSAAMSANMDALRNKVAVDVVIDGHYTAKVYTSGSAIIGRAEVRPLRDVSFHLFEIVLVGTAATRLDFVQQFPAHSARNFLKLRMPIALRDLPEDNTFRQGKTYTVPFHFVIPHQLTMGACTHRCSTDAVQAEHLRLPPTMGFWEDNDQSPDMSHVKYAIKVRAWSFFPGEGQMKLFEGQHVLKILPARPEDAPLDITWRDERYQLTNTKTIRKKLFSAKLGKVTASALQPAAVLLSADASRASQSSARINLDFDPASAEMAPPKVHAVSAKLASTTYFSLNPVEDLPNLGPRANHLSYPSLSYTTTTPLFSKQTSQVSWEKHERRATHLRRDSGYSSPHLEDDAGDTEGSEGAGQGRRGSLGKASKKKQPTCPFKYTATVEVPFTVPTMNKKIFLPTFHSCLISRSYVLQLTLSVGPNNTSIPLLLPLQIGVQDSYDPQLYGEELPSFETAMAQTEAAQVDADLQPRLLRVPPLELQGGSELPRYDTFRGQHVSVV
ncbi:hypothetical protein S40293_06179 [Stachybotrys chartarum IBT 40293]|nr:hypothetical protein S40293_06179 [Stachybotrys chartarum IBT 40293]